MFDRNDLRAAFEADIISADVAVRLEAFLARRADPGASSDPKNLLFLDDFNDTFITIGITILVFGLTTTTGIMFGGMGLKSPGLASALSLLPVAGVMWLMAEYFCGRRRLLLTSMALALVFTVYIGLSIARLASGSAETIGLIGFGGMIGAALVFYWRFGLSFALMLVALSVAGAVYTGAGFFGGIGLVIGGLLSLLIGLATLAAAIVFDARDPARATHSSDIAFWLHMAAAPQIILGLRSILSGSEFSPSGPAEALTHLVALVAFGILSLALNRRALIVSGLLTFGSALTVLVSSAGGGVQTTFITTSLLLGGGIVLLGGGWKTARRALLVVLPKMGMAARIFPPDLPEDFSRHE